MAEPSEYECGFAAGYDRGFDAGRNQQPRYAGQLPYWTNTVPMQPAIPLPTWACSCLPGTVCQSSGCPRHTSVRY